MNNPWYIHVDKNTMQICKVTPVLEEDDLSHIIQIDAELGVLFVQSPHKLSDYVTFFDGTKAHIIKKELSNSVVVPFYYSPVIINKEIENADIKIQIRNKTLAVTMRPEMRNYAMTVYGSVSRDKQMAQFYVSAKNDPNKLIDVLQVDMMKVINTGGDTFPFDHDQTNISIFTRKIFDTYSLTK